MAWRPSPKKGCEPIDTAERNRIAFFIAARHPGRLSGREENPLSRDDLIQLEGMVVKMLGGGTMEIECDNQVMVKGVLSGRLKKHRIKVLVGDRVQVSVSPYDTSHGLVTYRF